MAIWGQLRTQQHPGAGDWDGGGHWLVVARSDDVKAAHQLAARLQALLGDR